MLDRFLSQLDVFLQDNRVGSLRRAECSEVTYLTYLYKSGCWVGKAVQTYKAFIDAVFKTLCNLANSQLIIVLNIVNGRCPGCDYINPVETCKHGLCPFGRSLILVKQI